MAVRAKTQHTYKPQPKETGFEAPGYRSRPEYHTARWARMRKRLNLPKEYQFYSLKDSGIRDLANSAGIVIARDQARHSSVAVTNKYLQGRDRPVHVETIRFKGAL